MNNSRIIVEFKGSSLKQNKVTFTPNKAVNVFIIYELHRWSQGLNANLNADPDFYSGFSIGFDSPSLFSFPYFDLGKNVVIFGVDNNSSVLVDDKKKDTFVLGEDTTQELDDTTMTAEAKFSLNFKESGKRFVLSLHYNKKQQFFIC